MRRPTSNRSCRLPGWQAAARERIRSAGIATRFRIWATQRLREYIVKGFVLDDERLKNPDQPFDYFEELMRRIQDIRASERRFCQKITGAQLTLSERRHPAGLDRGKGANERNQRGNSNDTACAVMNRP